MKTNQINSYSIQNKVNINKPLNESIKNIQFMFKNTKNFKSSELILKELNLLKSNNGVFEALPFGGEAVEPSLLKEEFTDLQSLPLKGEKVKLQKSTTLTPLSTALTTKNLKTNLPFGDKNSLNTLQLINILNKQTKNQKNDLEEIMNQNSKKNLSQNIALNNKSLLPYLNSLTQFNRKLANSQHVLYQFNKANNKSYKLLFDKTSKLLKLTFLGMGCLISRPVYKLTYTINNLEFEYNTKNQDFSRNFSQKVLIDLSYYIRKNQNKYLNNLVKENENIISISHPADPAELAEVNLPTLLVEGSRGLEPKSTDKNIFSLNTDSNNNIFDFNQGQYNLSKQNQRNNILCKYNDKFQFLTDYLNSIFKSEIELDLVRLHKVFYNSHILVQDIALKSYKFRFVKLVSRLFKKLHIQNLGNSPLKGQLSEPLKGNLNSLPNTVGEGMSFPSYLSGMNIKLAGRTFRQRVIPRMTVKRIQKGSLTNVNVQFIEKARFTGKTRRGAFSFTITLGHVFK